MRGRCLADAAVQPARAGLLAQHPGARLPAAHGALQPHRGLDLLDQRGLAFERLHIRGVER